MEKDGVLERYSNVCGAVSPVERKLIEAAAEKRRQSVSAFVRDATLQAAMSEVDDYRLAVEAAAVG